MRSSSPPPKTQTADISGGTIHLPVRVKPLKIAMASSVCFDASEGLTTMPVAVGSACGATARELTPGIASVPGGTGRSRMTGMRSPYVIAW